jgi:hypothetical protein
VVALAGGGWPGTWIGPLPPPPAPAPDDDLDFFLGFFFSSQTHTGLKESQKPTRCLVSRHRRRIEETER